MLSYKSLPQFFTYYKDWNLEIRENRKIYNCPKDLGIGQFEVIGDIENSFLTYSDFINYKHSLVRSRISEKFISVYLAEEAEGKYYSRKKDIKNIERGLNCSINFLPRVVYSRFDNNSVFKSTSLVIREKLLAENFDLNKYSLEFMASTLNNKTIYSEELLFLFKQLKSIRFKEELIPEYINLKAKETFLILFDYCLKAKTQEISEYNYGQIKKVKEYLDENYISPPSIEYLTEKFFINKKLLQKGFKALTGKTVYEYISYQRINHSVDLMENSEYNIGEIAAMVGYKSKMNFYNSFKKILLMTPKAFKDLYLK
ncbi:MAG: AraC family transcriptional regulator [Tissierellia bacterium]|nr:AraC family transcriptional regulator [Tissierellia bacterium]